MSKIDLLSIGHISIDYNVDYLGNLVNEIGGAVVFSSASAYALGHKVKVLTKQAEGTDLLKGFTLPKTDLVVLPSTKPTSIKNVYLSADKERRECFALSQGDPFTADDVSADLDSEIYHFAGLIYGDYEDGLIQTLAARGKVAVDVQGFLRCADRETGKMSFKDWADKRELLPYITYFKTDAAEAEILTGQSDRQKAADLFLEWGAKEVLITHNTEVIAKSQDGQSSVCPIKARNLSGRSGRGDTTFAAYITERLHNNVADSLLYATATVSLKMETPGPIRVGRAEIARYISEFYK
ncbi:MAG: PfkB family carbohydrate kinase [Christensenellaceae bacterium]|jgi:sugar/nucleoside kinase (ribokinase family)|nr:PfkB family carbohydrate kinase [Christensenellaceae bacterium]